MWKNVLYFMMGGLVFSVLIARPIIAQESNFTNVSIAMSSRELAVFKHNDGVVYYYNKADGKIIRYRNVQVPVYVPTFLAAFG